MLTFAHFPYSRDHLAAKILRTFYLVHRPNWIICISRLFLLCHLLLHHFTAIVSVIVIAFLSSEQYFIIGFYSIFILWFASEIK